MRNFLFVILLGAVVTGKVSAAPFLYDGIAALVGTELITAGDGYFYRAVARLRDGTGNPLQREAPEQLRKTVQRVAFERMVELEVKNLQVELPVQKQASAEWEKMKRAPGGVWKKSLEQFGRSAAEGERVLARMILVERFLQKKLDTLNPIITEAEVEKYFAENQGQFQGQKLDAIRASLTVLMKKERMQKGLEEWIRFLKGKYGLSSYLDA